MLCRDAERSHLTQSWALIPLQPRQPGTTSSLHSWDAVRATASREEAPGRPGAGNVSCGTGAEDAQPHSLAVTGAEPLPAEGSSLGTVGFSCISEKKTGALPTPGTESLAAALEGLGGAVPGCGHGEHKLQWLCHCWVLSKFL